jgi:hypothetical protein
VLLNSHSIDNNFIYIYSDRTNTGRYLEDLFNIFLIAMYLSFGTQICIYVLEFGRGYYANSK